MDLLSFSTPKTGSKKFLKKCVIICRRSGRRSGTLPFGFMTANPLRCRKITAGSTCATGASPVKHHGQDGHATREL